MTALEHITLTTGAARVSPRSEVSDDVVQRVGAALATGATLRAVSIHLAPTVPAGTALFDILVRGTAAVRCWLCWSADASEDLWTQAESGITDERVVVVRPRGVPWLAVAMLPGLLTLPQEDMLMLGDVERCVAWAVIEG